MCKIIVSEGGIVKFLDPLVITSSKSIVKVTTKKNDKCFLGCIHDPHSKDSALIKKNFG